MSERPIILQSAKENGFHGNHHGFFVVSSENLEFVGWHSGALPWSFSFLVEDLKSRSQYLDLVLPSNWWWGKIFGVLHLPSPASYISSVLLSSDWIEKKNIICFIKENLLPKRIRRYLKEKNRKKTGQKTFEVLDIIHLKETLRRFWKSKKKIVWRISSILEGSLVFAEASLLNNFRWVTSNDVYIQKL